MSTTGLISPDLRTVLGRLRLSPILDTLPERLALARQQQITHQDFLLLVLADENRPPRQPRHLAARTTRTPRTRHAAGAVGYHCSRHLRSGTVAGTRVVTLRRATQTSDHPRPGRRGKTFLAHALGHIACRHGHSVLAVRADKMLKALKHARLDNSYEAELRKFLAVDLLLVDDFALDSMDVVESRDAHEIITERHRAGSMIFTFKRGPDEWLTIFADPMRAQSAIDRLTGNAYDLIIEGESYRQRLKPRVSQ